MMVMFLVINFTIIPVAGSVLCLGDGRIDEPDAALSGMMFERLLYKYKPDVSMSHCYTG